jgi:hypothetical protein
MENWTTFNGRQFSRNARNEPRVTLGKKGNIYLNGKAYEALGRPAAVEMSYEGNQRVIGLKPTDQRRTNAFKVRNHTTGNYKRISAAAFCQHFRIRPTSTLLFQNVDITREGIMTLDLTNTITVTRGAR